VRSGTVRTAVGHICTVPREGFPDGGTVLVICSGCTVQSLSLTAARGPVRTTTISFSLLRGSVPPYLADNFSASPLAGSFMRTVGKTSGVHAAMVVGPLSVTNLQPKCKAMPTPVGVWWAFAKYHRSPPDRTGLRNTAVIHWQNTWPQNPGGE
jgi:hypothetical protein